MMFVTVSLYFPQFWPRKHLVHPKWWFFNNNNSCMFFQFFREQKVYIFYNWGVAIIGIIWFADCKVTHGWKPGIDGRSSIEFAFTNQFVILEYSILRRCIFRLKFYLIEDLIKCIFVQVIAFVVCSVEIVIHLPRKLIRKSISYLICVEFFFIFNCKFFT